MACTKPLKWKRKESNRLTGETDQNTFMDLGFERWQVVGFKKARGN